MFSLPFNYSIQEGRNLSLADKWSLYRLLILNRKPEPIRRDRGIRLHDPRISIPLILWLLILCLTIPKLSSQEWLDDLIRLPLLMTALIVIVLQIAFLSELFSTHRKRLAIALYRQKIIGCGLIAFREGYSVLLGLYIAPRHRGRGIGSGLVAYLARGDILPIYLSSRPDLTSFYTRLGFILTSEKRGYNMVLRSLE